MSNDSFTAPNIFASLQRDLRPWQRIDWSPYIKSRIFRDWGQYYSRRQWQKKALASFRNALEVSKELAQWSGNTTRQHSIASTQNIHAFHHSTLPDTYKTLYARSKCYSQMADNEAALKDVLEAQRLLEANGQLQSRLTLDKCAMLFDCNRFEENLSQLFNESRKFQGQLMHERFAMHQAQTFAVLDDCLGNRLDPFMLQHRPLLLRKRATAAAFMPCPMWQRLRDSPQCDVESMSFKPIISLAPLERARRRVAEKVYDHHCLGRSAADVAMLAGLRSNALLLHPLNPQTTGKMLDFSNEQYAIVRKFMKMLHARRPLYQVGDRNRENYLYYVEYQTSRDCYHILREVRRLRLQQNIDRLTDYIEHMMSTKIALKTHRTLRWKFEFINEIYNMLGLAHLDELAVPKHVDFLNPNNHAILYRLPKDRMKYHTSQFGGRNIYDDIDRDDERVAHAKLAVKKLQDRLLHSRYGIERAYLMFAIARQHFRESQFGKCITMARKANREATGCGSVVWRFNASFLVCQVHASFNRHERLKDSLLKANNLAKKLNSPQLLAYLELCSTVNNYELDFHRNKHADYYWRCQRKRKGGQGSPCSE